MSQRTFAPTSAKEMPIQICAGAVSSLQMAGLTKSGKYINQKIDLTGYGTTTPRTIYFLYRPEWLKAGFQPDVFYKDYEGANGYVFTYGKNIASRDEMSTLKGLVGGSEERFSILADALLSVGDNLDVTETANAEKVMAQVTEILQHYLVGEGFGKLVLYSLKQDQEEVGVDADGKKIYSKTKFMNVDRFYRGDTVKNLEKTYKRLTKYAADNPGKMVLNFDLGDIPPDAVPEDAEQQAAA